MTKFDEVFQEYEKQKMKKLAAERALAIQKAEEGEEFSNNFLAAIAPIKPIFAEFATEARRHGFPSAVEDGHDQHGNPYLQVRFFPERYVVTSTDTSRDCTFILMANLEEQKVVAESRFHLWPDKNSTRNIAFTKHTLSSATLTKLLYEFLRISLEARDED